MRCAYSTYIPFSSPNSRSSSAHTNLPEKIFTAPPSAFHDFISLSSLCNCPPSLFPGEKKVRMGFPGEEVIRKAWSMVQGKNKIISRVLQIPIKEEWDSKITRMESAFGQRSLKARICGGAGRKLAVTFCHIDTPNAHFLPTNKLSKVRILHRVCL